MTDPTAPQPAVPEWVAAALERIISVPRIHLAAATRAELLAAYAAGQKATASESKCAECVHALGYGSAFDRCRENDCACDRTHRTLPSPSEVRAIQARAEEAEALLVLARINGDARACPDPAVHAAAPPADPTLRADIEAWLNMYGWLMPAVGDVLVPPAVSAIGLLRRCLAVGGKP